MSQRCIKPVSVGTFRQARHLSISQFYDSPLTICALSYVHRKKSTLNLLAHLFEEFQRYGLARVVAFLLVFVGADDLPIGKKQAVFTGQGHCAFGMLRQWHEGFKLAQYHAALKFTALPAQKGLDDPQGGPRI